VKSHFNSQAGLYFSSSLTWSFYSLKSNLYSNSHPVVIFLCLWRLPSKGNAFWQPCFSHLNSSSPVPHHCGSSCVSSKHLPCVHFPVVGKLKPPMASSLKIWPITLALNQNILEIPSPFLQIWMPLPHSINASRLIPASVPAPCFTPAHCSSSFHFLHSCFNILLEIPFFLASAFLTNPTLLSEVAFFNLEAFLPAISTLSDNSLSSCTSSSFWEKILCFHCISIPYWNGSPSSASSWYASPMRPLLHPESLSLHW